MSQQYEAFSHIAGGWSNCKVCNALPPAASELVEWQGHVRWAAQQVALYSEYIRRVLEESVANVLEAERRRASHNGAVRARKDTDPCHYQDDNGRFFDAGNSAYMLVLGIVLPDLSDERGWNENTTGNLVEMLLAHHIAGDNFLNVNAMKALDYLCYTVYIYSVLLWRLDCRTRYLHRTQWISKYVDGQLPPVPEVGPLSDDLKAGANLAGRVAESQWVDERSAASAAVESWAVAPRVFAGQLAEAKALKKAEMLVEVTVKAVLPVPHIRIWLCIILLLYPVRVEPRQIAGAHGMLSRALRTKAT